MKAAKQQVVIVWQNYFQIMNPEVGINLKEQNGMIVLMEIYNNRMNITSCAWDLNLS
jgi:hypothetical protein